MNLKKLNLVELNFQELKETEGGIIPWLVRGAAVAAAWVVDNWDDIKEGHDKYRKKHNI
ncbi:class IIb bacteriocin, lactobin A/cerein 7B family [Elizabethkingia anophelis]|nr:class IIb bacteriocin, lactobin A/cerein 7B family [Elizabethkingia anophelis]